MPEQADSAAGLERPGARMRQVPGGPGHVARAPGSATWLVALAALTLMLTALNSRILWADSFYDLYAGRYILWHGIPHRNVVTVASHGAPWIDQQWLAHLSYYGAWAAGGYPAVAALSALLVTSGFVVLGLLMLSRGIPPTRMFAWSAAAFIVYLGNIVIRAQSFAYPLFALTLWLIVADSGAPRLRPRTWLVIPVLVIWANTHGSVLLGMGLVALYAGYRAAAALLRRDRRPVPAYLALLAAAAVSVLCTPYGTSVITYYRQLNAVTPALARNVVEWQVPNPLYRVSVAFFVLVVVVAVAVAVAWRRGTRPDPLLAAIALVLLGLALTAIRNQTWFSIAGCLLAADALARSSAARPPRVSRAFGYAAASVLAGVALAGLGVLATRPDAQYETQVPVRAVDVAAALAARHPTARILGDDVCAPVLLWLYPATFGRVGFDARLEQYSLAQLDEYAAFLSARGRGWQRVMRGYDIVVASRHHPRLATALVRLRGWRLVYSGPGGIVAERRP